MSYSDQNFPRRLIAYRSYSLTGCRNKFFRDYPLSLGSSVFIAMNMAFESQPIGGRQLVGTAPTNDATKTTIAAPSPAGSLVVSLLGRIRLHVRRVSIVFAQPWRIGDRCGRARRWKARSSLSATLRTLRALAAEWGWVSAGVGVDELPCLARG